MKKLIVLLGFTLTLLSCSLFVPTPSGPPKSKDYSIKGPVGWNIISPEKADYSFFHPQTKSILITNSECAKYENSSLENLSSDILSGVSALQIIKKEYTSYAQREALKTFSQGKVDGIDVFVHMLTLKRNRCVYDFALISTRNMNAEDVETFENFLQGITFTKMEE